MRWLQKKKVIDPTIYHSEPGSRKKEVLSPLYDGKKMTLIASGEIDIQDQINSHRMEVDMDYIRSRLSNGDLSVLNPAKPIYADFHNLPTNFREVLDVALNAERIFNTLPVDERQHFDNDYRQFVASAGSKEWNDIMRPYLVTPAADPDVPVPVKEVSNA